jgi:hypothetical protein
VVVVGELMPAVVVAVEEQLTRAPVAGGVVQPRLELVAAAAAVEEQLKLVLA